MKVPLHVISAAHIWVRDENIEKDIYEVNRAFKAGAKYVLNMQKANEVKTSSENIEVCPHCGSKKYAETDNRFCLDCNEPYTA